MKSNIHDVKPNLLFALLQQLFNLLTLYVSKGAMAIVIFQHWICTCTNKTYKQHTTILKRATSWATNKMKPSKSYMVGWLGFNGTFNTE